MLNRGIRADRRNFGDLVMHPDPASVRTGKEARRQFRSKQLAPFTQTTGLAMGYMQASPVIIPKDLALEFLTLCHRNPKPCPAISDVGDPSMPTFGEDIDVRTDLGGYRVWRDGETVSEVTDIRDIWRDNFVTFAIGCSYSFEDALLADGLELRHHTQNCCVPMYRNQHSPGAGRPLLGQCLRLDASLQPGRRDPRRRITSRFPLTHGTPLHIGDPAEIGIADIATPLVGDPVEVRAGELPVFWGRGITPQYALLSARPEIAITHKPGCLLVSDLPSRSDGNVLPMPSPAGSC